MKNDFDTSKKAFLSLTSEQQRAMLFDMCQALSNAQAIDSRDHVGIRSDLTFIKGEITGIGRREMDETLTTTQKFDALYNKRSVWWIWYRDGVLRNTLTHLHTLVVVAILALTFGKALMNLLP